MNTNRALKKAAILGTLAICPASPLLAIEPPPDDAKPPAALLRGGGKSPAAADNLPFLGLSTATVPDMVAEHLGLQGGSGVIIRTVCPDSPAQAAGLGVNDIILTVNGTSVGTPDDFTDMIRRQKAGDRLQLGLIRKGKPDSAEVTLTERPAELEAHLRRAPWMGALPGGQAERLRELMERNLQGFGADHLGILPDQDFENTFRQMRERMNRAFGEEIDPMKPQGGGAFKQNSTVRLMDGQGSVEIRTVDGDTRVTVRDTSNKVAWEGEWNTDEDKQAAPEDIRKRIESLQVNGGNGRGFSFRFGKSGGGDGTIEN